MSMRIFSPTDPDYEVLHEQPPIVSTGKLYKLKRRSDNKIFTCNVIRAFSKRNVIELVRREVDALQPLADCRYTVHYQDVSYNPDRLSFHLHMDWMQGGDLSAYIKSFRDLIPAPTIAQMMLSLSIALFDCHQRGICHEDIRPQNIMLMKKPWRNGTEIVVGYLTNFGLRALAKATGHHTRLNAASPSYSAPECLTVEDPIFTTKSDMFSLGCVMFELCCGELAYPDADRSKFPSMTVAARQRLDKDLMSMPDNLLDFDPERRPSISTFTIAVKAYCAERLQNYTADPITSLNPHATNEVIMNANQPNTVFLPQNTPQAPSASYPLQPASTSLGWNQGGSPAHYLPAQYPGQGPGAPLSPAAQTAPQFYPYAQPSAYTPYQAHGQLAQQVPQPHYAPAGPQHYPSPINSPPHQAASMMPNYMPHTPEQPSFHPGPLTPHQTPADPRGQALMGQPSAQSPPVPSVGQFQASPHCPAYGPPSQYQPPRQSFFPQLQALGQAVSSASTTSPRYSGYANYLTSPLHAAQYPPTYAQPLASLLQYQHHAQTLAPAAAAGPHYPAPPSPAPPQPSASTQSSLASQLHSPARPFTLQPNIATYLPVQSPNQATPSVQSFPTTLADTSPQHRPDGYPPATTPKPETSAPAATLHPLVADKAPVQASSLPPIAQHAPSVVAMASRAPRASRPIPACLLDLCYPMPDPSDPDFAAKAAEAIAANDSFIAKAQAQDQHFQQVTAQMRLSAQSNMIRDNQRTMSDFNASQSRNHQQNLGHRQHATAQRSAERHLQNQVFSHGIQGNNVLFFRPPTWRQGDQL